MKFLKLPQKIPKDRGQTCPWPLWLGRAKLSAVQRAPEAGPAHSRLRGLGLGVDVADSSCVRCFAPAAS